MTLSVSSQRPYLVLMAFSRPFNTASFLGPPVLICVRRLSQGPKLTLDFRLTETEDASNGCKLVSCLCSMCCVINFSSLQVVLTPYTLSLNSPLNPCVVIKFPSPQVVFTPCAPSLNFSRTPCALSLNFSHSKLSLLHVLCPYISLTPSCPCSMCCVLTFPSLQVVLAPCTVSLNVPRTPCAASLYFTQSKLSSLHVLCHYISLTPSCH